MEPVKLQQVIITTLTTRGNGTTIPVREVKEVWSVDGDLIANWDTLKFTIEEIEHALKILDSSTDEKDREIIKCLINLRK